MFAKRALTVALVGLAAGCGGKDEPDPLQDGPLLVRPLSVRQEGAVMQLKTGTCRSGSRDACPRERYPRQPIDPIDPRRPFRFTFSSVARVDVSAWKRTPRGYRRIGSWDGSIQCIDSACADEARIPPRPRRRGTRRLPKSADTLRIVVYRAEVEGAEIALGP